MPNPTQEDLKKVIRNEPDLSTFGLVWLWQRKKPADRKRFLRDRRALSGELQMFRLCCKWLSLCGSRKTINMNIGSSYALKHEVERWSGEYITNGAFVAAVIHLGIPFKRYSGSPNIAVALSSRLPSGSSRLEAK